MEAWNKSCLEEIEPVIFLMGDDGKVLGNSVLSRRRFGTTCGSRKDRSENIALYETACHTDVESVWD